MMNAIMATNTMTTIEIPQEILDSARLSPQDAKLELAINLYAANRLSIGKARELAGMSLWEFRQILTARQIPAHYDVSDLYADIDTLHDLHQE